MKFCKKKKEKYIRDIKTDKIKKEQEISLFNFLHALYIILYIKYKATRINIIISSQNKC